MTSYHVKRASIAAVLAAGACVANHAAAQPPVTWPEIERGPTPVVPVEVSRSFMMLIQSSDDGAGTDAATDADDGGMSRRLRDALSPGDDEPTVEDRRRTERLRELLRDNGDDANANEDLSDLLDIGDDADTEDDQAEDDDSDGGRLLSEPFLKERLPQPTASGFMLPPLMAVSSDTAQIGNGRMPEDFDSASEFAPIPMPQSPAMRPGWTNVGLVRTWAAPNTYNHPLYYEDRMLERHGHDRFGYLQPFAGGVRFMSQAIMLPYLATLQPPCEVVYSNGYYRAGSPAPLLWQRPPYERRAVVVQAAATAGAFIAIP